MTKKLFKPTDKFSDLIEVFPSLLHTLSRFGIELGFGERSVREVCQMSGIDTNFFLLMSNVYAHQDYIPSLTEIKNTDMTALVPYLKRSHDFYLNKRMPHISEHLNHIAAQLPQRIATAITAFYQAYFDEVREHFNAEEQQLFPHIESMLAGLDGKKLIDSMKEAHSNIEDKLDDLNQILFKYLPHTDADDDTIDVVFDIVILSHDLRKHALVEEKILMPYVELLEKEVLS